MRPVLGQCVMRRGQFDTEFTLRALRAGLWLAEVPVPIVEIRPPAQHDARQDLAQPRRHRAAEARHPQPSARIGRFDIITAGHARILQASPACRRSSWPPRRRAVAGKRHSPMPFAVRLVQLHDGALTRPRIVSAILLLVLATLFVANFRHGVSLGQDSVMFEPPFRLRQSLVVALSARSHPPLRGYLGYADIEDFLNRHGMAIQDTENDGVQPTPEDWRPVLRDAWRLATRSSPWCRRSRSIPTARRSSSTRTKKDWPISSPSPSISSAATSKRSIKPIFLLLLIGCSAFALSFWRSPFLLYLLAAYLLMHYGLMTYAHDRGLAISTVHNSRFFRDARPSAGRAFPRPHVSAAFRRAARRWRPAVVQAALLCFVIFLAASRRPGSCCCCWLSVRSISRDT